MLSSLQRDRVGRPDVPCRPAAAGETRRTWLRELAWFALPLALCPLVALLRPGTEQAALARAEWLLGWQRSLGVAVEPSLHAWFSARPLLVGLATVFYLGAHLSAVIATACWLAARHSGGYVRFRRTFALAQVVTAVTYLAVPVAPLRMLLTGEPVAAGGSWTHSMQYEFAAMPSGHVVFALVVAMAVWQHAPARWRWIGIAHPVCTILVIVATANHLVVDAAAAVPVVVVATWAAGIAGRTSPVGRATRGALDRGSVA